MLARLWLFFFGSSSAAVFPSPIGTTDVTIAEMSHHIEA